MKPFTRQDGAQKITSIAGSLGTSTRIEARSGIVADGVAIGADGTAIGFRNNHGAITFSISAARPGLFALRVLARSPGEKAFEIRVGSGGILTGRFTRSTGSSPAAFDAGLVELPAGPTTLTIGRGWGYYEIAGIELSLAKAPLLPQKLSPTPADPKVTPAARELLRRIVANYGNVTFSGQYGTPDCASIQSMSGRLPAIVGGDLMDYSPSRRERGADPKNLTESLILAAQRDRQIVTMSWHWNAPMGLIDREIREKDGKTVDARWYKGFYSNATTFDFAEALAAPRSEAYNLMLRDIDAIAVPLRKFADAGVPILWRPLHEADGGWFWWGTRGPQGFAALWRLVFDRLTNTHGLHNLLWVNSSGLDPAWYPGDRYVDIVGIDEYPADTADPLVPVWSTLLKRFDGVKPLALTEFGGVPDVARMQRYGVRWAYFVSWSGRTGPDKIAADTLKRLYNAPGVINRGA